MLKLLLCSQLAEMSQHPPLAKFVCLVFVDLVSDRDRLY